MAKTKDKIRVSFIGNNAESVAGSMTLITWGSPQRSMLIEAGLIQGESSLLQEYRANSANFKFKAKRLDYIFLSDNHADHSLMAPLVVKRGFEGTIFVPPNFKEIFQPMALDSAGIMARSAEDLSRKSKKEFEPIYEADDVYKTLALLKELPLNKKVKIDDDLSVELIPAGHTITSVQIVLYLCNKKLVFSGDLGNSIAPQIFCNPLKFASTADLFVGESTYASASKRAAKVDRRLDIEKIATVIDTHVIDGSGIVMFPTFSFMRTQVMLSVLYDLLYLNEKFTQDIYVASPLACKICDLFDTLLVGEEREKWKRIRGWSSVHFIKDFATLEETYNVCKNTGSGAIFLASSGFMVGGYSVWLAEQILPIAKDAIVFCGYASPDSLAGRIRDKKTKTVSINGKSLPSRCNVVNLNSFSSHMQHNQLLEYYSSGNFDKIALVHGDMDGKKEFQVELENKLRELGKTNKVICVNKGTEILL